MEDKSTIKEDKKKKKKTKRCSNCNKKVGLLGFTCRCSEDKIFCTHCRYPKNKETDEKGHTCNFDFQKYGKDILEKNNPKIEHAKLNNI